ncbi:luciferin 4-monooxygenase [Aphomia sociella]
MYAESSNVSTLTKIVKPHMCIIYGQAHGLTPGCRLSELFAIECGQAEKIDIGVFRLRDAVILHMWPDLSIIEFLIMTRPKESNKRNFSNFDNFIFQIDTATGEKETKASVLSRSIALARCLRKLGYRVGDVISLSGPNNINTNIPHYAALLNGMPYAGVDPTFKYDEIKKILSVIKPKISFCMQAAYDDHIQAIEKLNLDVKVLTLDEGENSMAKFIETYHDGNDNVEDFEPTVFDAEKTFAWLASTSGTTGVYKMAAITHRTILDVIRNTYSIYFTDAEYNTNRLMLSPVQWITGLFNAVVIPASGATILQTSNPTTEHIIDMINEYKPRVAITSYSTLSYILKSEKKCDLTCFKAIALVGSKVSIALLAELKSRMQEGAYLAEGYGQTETLGPILRPNPNLFGSCGTPTPWTQLKLVNPETGREITEPNTPGELWCKGPRFTEYYNNPEETAKAITKDGWYKTGDILYRDQEDNYFFVERFKMLIKYKNYHVYPLELEELIRTHFDVDVAVTSVEDVNDGEHPVAVVVRRPGSTVTAQEIKDLIANKLSNSKLLRGGVVFVDELPLTSTGKIAQMRLRQIVLNVNRE